MTARYVIYVPKSTETYSAGEDESKALERAKNLRGEDDYDVITLFRVEGDVQIPIAFFWNGQKFTPQKPVDELM